MSEDWIKIIPEAPRFVPEPANQGRARQRFAEIAPEADRIEVKLSETVQFFDCCANFESIYCPSCRSEISMDWWQERMTEDYADGFKLATYAVPCCGARFTLHDLDYDWPQGFGRFAIEALNANIGKLDDKYKRELEEILGTKLRIIYQHI